MTDILVQPDLIISGRARRDRDEVLILLALLTLADAYEAEAYWGRTAPTAFKGLLTGRGWAYNPPQMQWAAAQAVPSAKIKAAIIATVTRAETTAESLAGQLTAGELQLADWQTQMQGLIKSIQVAVAGVARGGIPRLDTKELGLSADAMILKPEDVKTTGDVVLYQFKRLALFALQIESRSPGVDTIKQIADRAKLYVRQAITFYEQARNREAKAVGVTEEMNMLGEAEHCFSPKGDPTPDCPSQTAYGWAPIGTLTPVGLRKCRMNCLCTMHYRRGAEELK